MEKLILKLQQSYPHISFVQGSSASWSAKQQQVIFKDEASGEAVWTLLHELGHALCDHNSYKSDMDLLNKEAEAWQKAQEVARNLQLVIEDNYMQHCLDTYRDWLHKRSDCPYCTSTGLQRTRKLYYCLNCQNMWSVTEERFCRPYRLKQAVAKKKARHL